VKTQKILQGFFIWAMVLGSIAIEGHSASVAAAPPVASDRAQDVDLSPVDLRDIFWDIHEMYICYGYRLKNNGGCCRAADESPWPERLDREIYIVPAGLPLPTEGNKIFVGSNGQASIPPEALKLLATSWRTGNWSAEATNLFGSLRDVQQAVSVCLDADLTVDNGSGEFIPFVSAISGSEPQRQ
jgi:hypothetical protein